jgi:uncharacterized protein YegL
MPRLNTDDMQVVNAGNFGFSAVGVGSLGASEYTLVTIALDVSGSVDGFTKEIESALQEVIKSCSSSPRADNLLVRVISFNHSIDEIHGFKLLSECNVGDYSNILRAGGTTALFDATENSVRTQISYAKTLVDNDFSVNGIVVVITDGCNCAGTDHARNVNKALEEAVKGEYLDSLVSVLIGVNVDNQEVATKLSEFKNDANLSAYVSVKDASANSLAKVAQFVSKSISAQSQSLGNGPAQVSLTI